MLYVSIISGWDEVTCVTMAELPKAIRAWLNGDWEDRTLATPNSVADDQVCGVTVFLHCDEGMRVVSVYLPQTISSQPKLAGENITKEEATSPAFWATIEALLITTGVY